MAPKSGRGKTKGDKKKKEEKGIYFLTIYIRIIFKFTINGSNLFYIFAVLPVVVDIKVNLPDETHVILKVCDCLLRKCIRIQKHDEQIK